MMMKKNNAREKEIIILSKTDATSCIESGR